MRSFIIIYLIYFSVLGNENSLEFKLIFKKETTNENIRGIDNLNNIYTVKNNELIKSSGVINYYYKNSLYSTITSIDVQNSLKIKLFYEDSNTLVVLDNKLSEISKINFNIISPNKIISKFSASNDNNVWIYNELNSKIELYNYINNTFRIVNSEISGEVISLKSNYKYCWVLTDSHIYKFNYFGSLITKTVVNNIQQIEIFNDNLFFKKDNELFYYDQDLLIEYKLDLENLLIKDFFVINQSLYIYDSEHFIKYQIQKK
ncbi:hypothetical protein N9K27_02005 [Flavobacteriaceae bacterium]|nr:hypothetical protein [Flavobacteriaceae bacterium]